MSYPRFALFRFRGKPGQFRPETFRLVWLVLPALVVVTVVPVVVLPAFLMSHEGRSLLKWT